MDITTLALAKSYTDEKIAQLPKGIIYKGAVNYYNMLPANPNVGDCYTVKYKGSSGTEPDGSEYVWGSYEGTLQWISVGQKSEVEIVKLTDGSETLAQLATRLNEINSSGRHVFFDTAALGYPLYLCTIMISYNGQNPDAYKLNDMVTGSVSMGSYSASKTLNSILAEAVSAFYTLTVTCATLDSAVVTGQTVTVRQGGASGSIYKTATYNGQPVSFIVPNGFNYFVSVSDTLAGHFSPSTAAGVIGTNTSVTLTYKSISSIVRVTDVKEALEAGLDLTQLVGETIKLKRGNVDLDFDVADYDSSTHTVTCLEHYCDYSMAFEHPQALAWFENGLAAGSYSFVHGSNTYYFTLTVAIPANGQLCATTSTFTTYEDQYTTTRLELGNVSTTAVEGAVSLGTTATDTLNHMDRVLYGSNNGGESGLFAWLNSNAMPNTILQNRLNKLSRPYNVGTSGGFMYGMDANELAVIDDTTWIMSANNVYEAPASLGGISQKGVAYNITGKFWLASREDVGFTGSNPLDIYVGATAADRIKYRGTSAQWWWLRSCIPSGAFNECYVYTSGSESCNRAVYSYGVAAAFKISKSS